MNKQRALDVQGRALERKQASCNAPATSTTESFSASAKELEYNLRLKWPMKLQKIFLKYLQEMDMFLIAVHDVDILT